MAGGSVAEAVAAVIESENPNGPFSRWANTLIVNEPLPDSVSRACRVQVYSSLPPRRVHGVSGPAYMYPRVQVLVRGEPNDPTGPEIDSYALYHMLGKIRDIIIEGHRIINIDVLDYPVPFSSDGMKRRSYAFNIQIDEGSNE